jgi:predicted Zn-dependent protease
MEERHRVNNPESARKSYQEIATNVCPVPRAEVESNYMRCPLFLVIFGSTLLLALAAGTARANDPAQNPAAGSAQDLSLVSSGTGPASPVPAVESRTDRSIYEGAKWNSGSVITWSIADTPGPADSSFSGYMGSQYEGLVRQAFQTWAAASGLNFEEVADSSLSDIRLGWGNFNTASTRVVGYTLWRAQSGRLLPNNIIRLEDPLQDPLVAGTGGTLIYSGTNANLYQVFLHEIGHALGLADNHDPDSVMHSEATGANNTLASNDVAGIRSLYGSPTVVTHAATQAAASELSGTSMNSVPQQSPASVYFQSR